MFIFSLLNNKVLFYLDLFFFSCNVFDKCLFLIKNIKKKKTFNKIYNNFMSIECYTTKL